MPRYFPSRKVFVVGVLAIGLLAWSIVYEGTSQQNSAIEDTILRSVASAESAFPDSDGDGLYDWEEALHGTDPKNPDSDEDGVGDGKQYVSEAENINIRLSDSVYSAVNRLGEEVQNAPNPIDLLSKEPKVYDPPFSRSNLQVHENTQENRDRYILDIMVALSEHGPVLQEDPLALTQEWLQTKSPSTLERIRELNEKTMSIARDLLSIPVPSHFVETHLSIANNLYLSALSLQDIETTTVDPMTGFFATATHINHQSKYLQSVEELIGFGYATYE